MKRIYWVVLTALLFTILFYKQRLGLNLVIFEGIVISFLLGTKSLRLTSKNAIILFSSVITTLIASIFVHSIFAYIMNFISLFMLVAFVEFPQMKSLLSSLAIAFPNIFRSQGRFFTQLSELIQPSKKGNFRFRRIRIFLIPLAVIILFIIIYSGANPVFNKYTLFISESFSKTLNVFFENINLLILLVFILGFIITNYIFLSKSKKEVEDYDINANDDLERKRKRLDKNHSLLVLKNEYLAGVFLLISLNALLLIINIIDLNWVWINFEWEGQFLKGFVHKGTYLLILSILISISIVLYFFRGNINFYSKNKPLKILSYIWLGQNMFLVLSVALRNIYYVQHFALAYKRIGVFIFLILTLYGLYTVFNKVKNRKSGSYVVKNNVQVAFIVLTLCALLNWDGIIAKYNFAHADSAFLHLNFMYKLSDKTLPILNIDNAELQKIEITQEKKFSFKGEPIYMDHEKYSNYIQIKCQRFILEWENKSLFSWNWAEYNAYKKLKPKQE